MIFEGEKILENRGRHHIGIEVFRAWLSLMVVYNHAPAESTAGLAPWFRDGFSLLCLMGVPCFVLISFYLSGPMFFQERPLSVGQFEKKFKRMLVPFIGWSLVGFLFYPKRISIGNIFLQLFFGAVVNAPLYYLAITLYFILFFSAMTLLNIRLRLVVLCVLTVFCFYIQYAGLNHNVFSALPESLRYTLGRLGELFPYAVAGIFLRNYFNMSKCYDPEYRADWRWLLVIIPAFVAGVGLLRFTPEGFGYQGIGLLMCSFSAFLLCLIQPNRKIAGFVPKKVLSISSVSLGIFCSHYLLGRIFRSWFGDFSVYDTLTSVPFVYGLVLYLCSILLCVKLKSSFNGRLASFVS